MQGGLNTYGYVGGNPVNWIDPTGEIILPPIVKKAIATAAIAVGLSGTPTPNPNDGNKTNSVPGERVEQVMDRDKATNPAKESQRTNQPKTMNNETLENITSNIPGFGPLLTGIGLFLYPSPLGCATLDCNPQPLPPCP